MTDQIITKKPKRKSKGERKHIRRMKQAARKEANYNSPKPAIKQTEQLPKKQDKPL